MFPSRKLTEELMVISPLDCDAGIESQCEAYRLD